MGAPNIYHERQIRELCALHALNNLFQGNTIGISFTLLAPNVDSISILAKGSYSKSQLDEICKQLSPDEWINPHRYYISK